MTPTGWRASDVTPDMADRKQNFSQSARRISAESAASTPAATHASRKAGRRIAVAALERADHETRHRARMRDDARLANRGGNVRDTAENALRS